MHLVPVLYCRIPGCELAQPSGERALTDNLGFRVADCLPPQGAVIAANYCYTSAHLVLSSLEKYLAGEVKNQPESPTTEQ